MNSRKQTSIPVRPSVFVSLMCCPFRPHHDASLSLARLLIVSSLHFSLVITITFSFSPTSITNWSWHYTDFHPYSTNLTLLNLSLSSIQFSLPHFYLFDSLVSEPRSLKPLPTSRHSSVALDSRLLYFETNFKAFQDRMPTHINHFRTRILSSVQSQQAPFRSISGTSARLVEPQPM